MNFFRSKNFFDDNKSLSRLLPVVVETIAHLIIKKNDDNKLAVETIARLPLFSAIN